MSLLKSFKLDGNYSTIFVSSEVCNCVRQTTIIYQVIVCLSDLSVARATHLCDLLKR